MKHINTLFSQVVAVAARKLEDARDFAQKHNILRVYGSYEELARDPDIGEITSGLYGLQQANKALNSSLTQTCHFVFLRCEVETAPLFFTFVQMWCILALSTLII